MESLLLPASIVGCSVSVLFALSTFAVLGCYRAKTRPLMIKQQLALALAFTYIVVLSGLQGYENTAACRTVTILIHYGVLASFLWIFVDIYHTSVCVKRETFPENFIKVLFFIWGIPLIFLIMSIIIGLTITSNFSLRSKFYVCWKSDHLIWTLVLPCLAVFFISCYYLIVSSNATFTRRRPNPSQKERRSIQAIKYSIKTNVVMLILTVIIWIFACEIFWYNKDVKYQLVFGLTVGVQGLFLFFFYCVFCLEHDLYVSDNIVDDFSSHFYDEVECSPGGSNILDYQDTTSKEVRNSITEEKSPQPIKSNFIQDDSFKIIETDPDSVPRLVSEANLNDRIDCTAKTTVLVHTPEKTPRSNVKDNEYIQLEEKNSVVKDVKQIKDKEDVNNNNNNINCNESNNENNTNDLNKEILIKENITEIQNNINNETEMKKPENKEVKMNTSPSDSNIKKYDEKKTLAKTNAEEQYKRRSYTGSEFSLGDDLSTRPRLGSSTSPMQGDMMRPTRSSSRSSQTSYASTMGLNELESLFNNPDLMKQSISNRNRLRSNQEETKKRDAPKKPTRTTEQTTNSSSMENKSEKKNILTEEAPAVEKNNSVNEKSKENTDTDKSTDTENKNVQENTEERQDNQTDVTS